METIVLIFERVSCGVVGVGFRRGAGFFVSRAQAGGAEFAGGAGLASRTSRRIPGRKLASIARPLRDSRPESWCSSGGCARFDVVAERLAGDEFWD